MRTIKIYFKRAPFYNAFTRLSPSPDGKLLLAAFALGTCTPQYFQYANYSPTLQFLLRVNFPRKCNVFESMGLENRCLADVLLQ